MDRRFERRKEALLAEPSGCGGVSWRARASGSIRGAVRRLLVAAGTSETHFGVCLGFDLDVDRKNTESIAYRHDQGRKNLQHFIGQAEWDHAPLFVELARQVGQTLGRPDGVLVFDPSGFPKRGKSRWACSGNGADGWARSTIVRWPCTWGTFRLKGTRWRTRACTFPKSGPPIACDARNAAYRVHCVTKHDMR